MNFSTVSFLSLYLGLCLVKSAEAILWINNFSQVGDSDYFGGTRNLGANWSLTNIAIAPVTHTAEATPKAGYIATVTGQYSTAVVSEGNWGSTYDGQYLSLYVWGNGVGAETLQIQLVEEDYDQTDNSLPVKEETWSTASTALSWTGWRYLMFKLPQGATGNDFTPSGTNTDSTWNPDYAAAIVGPPSKPELRGVKSINFVTNANIYIDEVVISNVSSSVNWVREIFPSNDNEDNNIDITLAALPPAVSAILGGSASLTNANNKIVVVEEDPTDSSPSYPTDNLGEAIVGGAPDFGANDGVGGWLVTPSDTETAIDPSSYAFGSPHAYTVFVHPANASGEPGRCEVITFTTASPSSTIENKYKRSLIN